MRNLPRAVCVVVPCAPTRVGAITRKSNPAQFCLPGGKVEPGETLWEAAHRELFEETGCRVHDLYRVYTGIVPGGEGDQDYEVTTFMAPDHLEMLRNEPEPGESPFYTVSWKDLFTGSFGEYNKTLYLHLKGSLPA